jgi:hypothetical protein
MSGNYPAGITPADKHFWPPDVEAAEQAVDVAEVCADNSYSCGYAAFLQMTMVLDYCTRGCVTVDDDGTIRPRDDGDPRDCPFYVARVDEWLEDHE